MRSIAIVFLGLGVSVACGGKRVASAACEPVPAEFLVTGPAFRDCAVDRTAKPSAMLPSLRSATLPTRPPASGCIKVVIDMVVDTMGVPITRTAKVVESNDRNFEELVLSSLGSLRYTPAVKDKEKVAQLVRHERMMQFAVVVVPAGSPLPSRPPRGALPNC